MCISHKGNCRTKILIDRQFVEQVSKFRHLGRGLRDIVNRKFITE